MTFGIFTYVSFPSDRDQSEPVLGSAGSLYLPSGGTCFPTVGSLLSGITLSWFAPLLETNSPLLHNLEEFVEEFKACFGDTDGA